MEKAAPAMRDGFLFGQLGALSMVLLFKTICRA